MKKFKKVEHQLLDMEIPEDAYITELEQESRKLQELAEDTKKRAQEVM